MEPTRLNPIVNVSFDLDVDTLTGLAILTDACGLDTISQAIEFATAYTLENAVQFDGEETA